SLDDADNVDQLLDLVRDGHNLVDNLQAERDTAVNYVHTYQSGVTVHTSSARTVNQNLADALNTADRSGDDRLRAAADRILEITKLRTVRADDGTIEFAEPEDVPPAGTLNAMRAEVGVEVSRLGFATWPAEEEV